jgi:hypothetical protein
MMFTSLSKRSNVPGLRSGFVAGDAALIKAFLLYRTYHGGAMSPAVQAASVAAWNDEEHVIDNRRQYREKFAAVTPMLAEVLDVACPTPRSTCGRACPAFRGPHARPERRRGLRPRAAGSIQCDGFARQLPGARQWRRQPRRRPGAHGPGGRAAECLEAAGPHRALLSRTA